eukprot:6197259-Pleurochrysis_carterae.AAC.1
MSLGCLKKSADMNAMNAFPRISSTEEMRYYCALSTRVEFPPQIPRFQTWNRTNTHLRSTCNPQGFAVTVDQKDRPRAKFLDAKMYIHGIAARLGLGSDALADMRGFAIRGDPKMGRIFVSIPLHFEERLNRRASTTAVRNATMAPKKNKDLWFSFVVGLDFQGMQQEARAALRTALEA